MKRNLMTGFMAVMLAGATVMAQPGGPGGMGSGMAKFFGENKEFTTTMIATIENPAQPGTMTMEMNLSMLDGKVRVEMDMNKIKSASMPAAQLARMKQMGMDKTVSIIRPDKKLSYTVFPGLQSYAAAAMTDKQVADALDKTKAEKTSMGKETIDGHACEKNKLVVKGDNGEKHEVMVWNATDMKDFPIKMEMDEKGSKMSMKCTDVKLEKPEAKLFEPPAAYTKYDTVQQMMQAEMMKKAGAGAPK